MKYLQLCVWWGGDGAVKKPAFHFAKVWNVNLFRKCNGSFHVQG